MAVRNQSLIDRPLSCHCIMVGTGQIGVGQRLI
jgi:hypothetical protein